MRSRVLVALLAGAAAAGVVLRVGVWLSHLGTLDVDEAVMGLAARGVLHGHVTALWPAQNYGGTLEPILTAPLVAAFGMSAPVVRTIPVVLFAVASLLTWRLGRLTVGEPAARVGAALLWVAPSYWIWKSERAHGFYGTSVTLELIVLILLVRLRRGPSWRDAGLAGLATGVAWWQWPGVFPVLGPAYAWLLVKRPTTLRYAALALPAAAVGATPWLLSNIRHDWWSLSGSSGDTPYALRLRGFVSSTLPMSFNTRIPFTSAWIAGKPLSSALFLALVGMCAFAAWKLRRTDASLLPVVLVAFGPLATISPYSWRITEPRYEIPLMPLFALLLAAALGARVRFAAVLVAAAAAASAVSLAGYGREDQFDDGADRIMPLVHELDRRHVTAFCAKPTIAFRVDFVTQLRITGGECDTGSLARAGNEVYPTSPVRTSYPDLALAVARRRYPAWAFIAGLPDEVRARPLLGRAGYRRTVAGVFAVYARPPRR